MSLCFITETSNSIYYAYLNTRNTIKQTNGISVHMQHNGFIHEIVHTNTINNIQFIRNILQLSYNHILIERLIN